MPAMLETRAAPRPIGLACPLHATMAAVLHCKRCSRILWETIAHRIALDEACPRS